MKATQRKKISDIVEDSIDFWEKGRLAYNAVLILIVLGYYIASIIQKTAFDLVTTVGQLLIMGIIANMLYCIAYFIDFFIQLSPWRDSWRKYRWALLAEGIILAAFLTCLMSYHIFL